MPAVSLVATLVATVLGFVLGALWYGPLFRQAMDGGGRDDGGGDPEGFQPGENVWGRVRAWSDCVYVFRACTWARILDARSRLSLAPQPGSAGCPGTRDELPVRRPVRGAHRHQWRVSCCSVHLDRAGVRAAWLREFDRFSARGSQGAERSQGSGLGGRCRPAGVGRCGVRAVRLCDPGAAGMPRRASRGVARGPRVFLLPDPVHERPARTLGRRVANRLPVRRDQPDDPPLGTDQDPRALDGEREPTHYVVRLTDPSLFECPLTMASDVGTIGLSAAEAEHLRLYLLKGRVLWVDDFWGRRRGSSGRARWRRCSRHRSTPITDVPLDDPIFNSQFVVHQGAADHEHRLLAQVARP